MGHLDVLDPGQVQQGCASPGLLERGGVPTTPSQHSKQTQGSQQGSQGSRAAGVPTSFPPEGCAGQAGVPGLYAQQQPQQGDRQTQTFGGAQGVNNMHRGGPAWFGAQWLPRVSQPWEGRQVSERFGAYGERSSDDPFLPSMGGGGLPIPFSPCGATGGIQQDIFAKSEKWLAPAPIPTMTQWRTREDEIAQWASHMDDLTAWAAQASLDFSVEISHASRWPREISWNSLNVSQQTRARRLLAIIRGAFKDHHRVSSLIGAFCEGVSLTGGSDTPGVLAQPANGYELVRQLTLEFSIRSRSEALSLRANLSARSFVLAPQETSTSSVVSDTIRKLDYEVAKFSKLLGTLPAHVDTTGLKMGESDLLLMLLRSLPEAVKQFCLHHSVGESYDAVLV